jgi:hypothetical protein
VTLYEQAKALINTQPLPDDAPAQLQALIEQAKGQERIFITHTTEALYSNASPTQIEQWASE